MMYEIKMKPAIKTDKTYPRLATVTWKGEVYEHYCILDARMAVDLAEGGSRIEFEDGDPTL